MKIGNLNINATPEQIIESLKQELQEKQARYIFRKTKSLANNFQFSCPFHSNGLENKPSCGMTRDTTRSGNKVTEAGLVHCFTCGYTASLPKFVADVLGNVRGELYGKQWLKSTFLSDPLVIRPKLELFQKGNSKNNSFVSEAELDKYRYTHDYMYKRGLTDDIIELFDIGFDERTNCLTFPIRDMNGRVVFIYRRGVTKKFHQYGEDDTKTDYLYGAYELLDNLDGFDADLRNSVYVTESVLNCLTLWNLGYPSISIMGTGGGNQYKLLERLPQRKIILALDPDDAGEIGQDKIKYYLKGKKIIQELIYPEYFFDEGLDINSNPDEIDYENLLLF